MELESHERLRERLIAGLFLLALAWLGGQIVSPAVAQTTDSVRGERTAKASIENPAPPAQALPMSLQPRSISKHRITTREQLKQALFTDEFTYEPQILIDPFKPFTTREKPPEPEYEIPRKKEEEEDFTPPRPQLPLTPLQKMTLGEVERGLRAILLGPLGKKALVEDGAGKGYVVAVGTPITGNDGLVTDIFEDGLVIRQEIWNRKANRYVPKEILIKLKRAGEEK